MSYTVESREARARARRRRAAITLTVTVLGLFFAFWYAYSYYRTDISSATANAPSSTCTSADLVPPGKITLNVYNSTNRNGLAAATARTLRQRGFRIGKVANDPLGKTIKGVAEVRFGKAGKARSRTVLALVPKATKARDKRKNASVDLVLGRKFTTLAPLPTGTCTPS